MLNLLSISEQLYHGSDYADYINGSSIWEVYATCPAQYRWQQKQATKALTFGSQVHTAVLEPELFNDLYVVEPDWSDCLSSDAAMKSWLKAKGQTGYSTKKTPELIDMILSCDETAKIKAVELQKWTETIGNAEVIKQPDMDILLGMQRTIHQFAGYSSLITNGHCEKSIVGKMHFEGIGEVMVKTRPDIISSDYLSITNYKTTTSAKPDDVMKSAVNFGYLAKEAFSYDIYVQWMREQGATDETISQVKVQILAQQKTAPFLPCGITLSQEQIEIGRAQYRSGLAALVTAKETDSWVTYTDGFIEVNTPAWAQYI